MQSGEFGRTVDGETVETATLAGEGLTVAVIGYGAAIRSLEVETASGPRPVVLGFDTLSDYVAHSPYFGAIAGRCANRIRGGTFDLDGREIRLDLNEDGRTHLHGGRGGFSARVWRLVGADDRSAEFALHSPDGDQGYPGALEARCRYALTGPGELTIDLSAVADAPTIVNLAAHSYFELDGGETVLDHRLQVAADAYTPVDADLIPTGAILPVAGTRFDFRTARTLRRAGEATHAGYDHNFVVARERSAVPRPMARLEGARSGIGLEVLSTEPGLQVYDGRHLGKVGVPLSGGRTARQWGAICLEPQAFPDAVHHPGFPPVVLAAGTVYRQRTIYRLTA